MSALPEILADQLGENCNDDDTIIIDDFRGYLKFIYAQKTDEIQTAHGNLVPMSDDFGGQTPVLNFRSDRLGLVSIPLQVDGFVSIPALKGEQVRLTYDPITHMAIRLLHGEAG